MQKTLRVSLSVLVSILAFGASAPLVFAVVGEGTATIDGVANVTVAQGTSQIYTIVLTVGASGISANAENPTFTVPASFTAPTSTPVATAGEVLVDGDWFVAGGATCVIDSPRVGLTAASGQVITVDVTTACTVGPNGTITLTYKGKSDTAGVFPFDVGTNDVISYAPVKSISFAPNNATLPTITVTSTTGPVFIDTNTNGVLDSGEQFFQTIQAAITAAVSGDVVGLNADVTTGAQVNVKGGVTIDGNGHTLYASFAKTDNSNNSAIGIQSSNVIVRDITLNGTSGTNLHGINVYQSTGVSLESVTVSNFRSGVVVNGSTVTATNLNASGNTWNSVNVDPGTGVTLPSIFTLNSGNLADNTQIWSDGSKVSGTATVTVTAPAGYTEYSYAGSLARRWTTSAINGVASIASAPTVLYTTIQSAITAAAPGDTINVGAGTYTTTGQVLIDKNLSIVGDTTNKPTINPVANLTANNNAASAWFLVNAGVMFNLSNVVLDGNSKKVQQAVRSHGTTSITNVNFANIVNSTDPYVGFAIANFGGTIPGGAGSDTHISGGSASALTVTDSTFANIGRIGVLVKGTGSTATLTGNTYTGKGGGTFLDYAFEFGAGGSGTVSGNTISGNRGVAADTSTSAGILVTEYYGSGTKAIINGNTFSNNSAGLHVGYLNTDTSVVTANGNNFSGETVGIESDATTVTVNATNNWWGTINPTEIAAKVAGAGLVDFDPYYTNAAMTTLSDGVGTDATYTSPTDGQADLPNGATEITLTDTTVLDLSNATIPMTSADVTVGGETVTLTQEVTLESGVNGKDVVLTNSNLPDVSVSIPDGTTISGPAGWDGTIAPPVSVAPSGTAPAGFSVGSTVDVGSPDVTLVFSNPVTILLAGVTGAVGYKPAGSSTWVQITNVCADPYLTPGNPPVNSECAISNGTDTKIVTYHFTSFGGLDPVPTPSGGGGWSGGGPQANPNSATPATPAVPGVSPAIPATPASPAQGRVLGAATYNFTRALAVGSRGADVTALQQYLIDNGFSVPAGATGYYGAQTRAAVITFQKARGIAQAGVIGPLTRAELNKGAIISAVAGKTNLTTEQANSIISIIESFGADAAVIAKVKASLGQ